MATTAVFSIELEMTMPSRTLRRPVRGSGALPGAEGSPGRRAGALGGLRRGLGRRYGLGGSRFGWSGRFGWRGRFGRLGRRSCLRRSGRLGRGRSLFYLLAAPRFLPPGSGLRFCLAGSGLRCGNLLRLLRLVGHVRVGCRGLVSHQLTPSPCVPAQKPCAPVRLAWKRAQLLYVWAPTLYPRAQLPYVPAEQPRVEGPEVGRRRPGVPR